MQIPKKMVETMTILFAGAVCLVVAIALSIYATERHPKKKEPEKQEND